MSREIHFEIDEATGELRSTIRGVPGKGCEEIAAIIKEYAGEPSVERDTPEHSQVRAHAQARPRVRAGGRA
jgi:hypothetical protein